MKTPLVIVLALAVGFGVYVAKDRYIDRLENQGPVSYTHLTLPTICSV